MWVTAILVTATFLAGCEFAGSKKIEISSTPIVTANVQDSMEAFKGKVVILDFWATWCGPCRVEIPSFIKLQEKYRDKGLEVIGVSLDPITPRGNAGGAAAVAPFMKENGINYTIWMVNNVEAMRGYDVSQGIPTTYIIDRKGKTIKVHVGAKPMQVFEDDITELL
jgi:thiol-disulfide isomerase/thioredoxin